MLRKMAYNPVAPNRKYAIWKCGVRVTNATTSASQVNDVSPGRRKWRSVAQNSRGVSAVTNILPS